MPEQIRQGLRFPVENSVFIELVSPEFGSNDAARMLRGKTVDISGVGLRINLDQPIPVDAILQVAVQLPAEGGTLYLVAEVRWCNPLPGTGNEPAWDAGLTLFNADDSDISTWLKLLGELETSNVVTEALE